MSSVNKVILIGRLGKDPEIRSMQSGDKIANISIATSESWNDRTSGERKEKTEWHRVVIFNEHLVAIAEKYATKGALVYAEGSLQTRKYTNATGHEVYTTEIVLGRFKSAFNMLSGGRDDRADAQAEAKPAGGGHRHNSRTTNANVHPRGATGPSWGGGPGNDLDDSIPF